MKPMPLARISLSSLRAFEAVARLGSLVEAATELNVSVSAVSHQLRELQDTLNVDLTAKRGRSRPRSDGGFRTHESGPAECS
jgi:LysR family glycine cleavage system transcriptional activator